MKEETESLEAFGEDLSEVENILNAILVEVEHKGLRKIRDEVRVLLKEVGWEGAAAAED